MPKAENPISPDRNPGEWPKIKSYRRQKSDTTQSVLFELYVPDDLAWLAGHFPGQPVVPGVVQVHWAAELCKEMFEIQLPFRTVENLKFQAMIPPDTHVDLQMECARDSDRIGFRYFSSETLFSEGKFRFAE